MAFLDNFVNFFSFGILKYFFAIFFIKYSINYYQTDLFFIYISLFNIQFTFFFFFIFFFFDNKNKL
jgi:hypothetical protein